MPFEKTATRLWKRLGREERLAAASAFWRQTPQDVAGTALAAIVKARHLRPQSARSLGEEEKARSLAAVLEPGETVASALLVALHLGPRRPMLTAFLDAAGLPHENGLLKEDDATRPSEAAARAGVQALAASFPRPEVEELVLEEVPDITYADVGGLDEQIEMIQDAVELPYLYADMFLEHKLQPPKGILLYGPPGCGKTLIAKAVANSLAKKIAERQGNEKQTSYFLNIKGPELLNKYVGETERHIRLVFQRAREKASEGMPVIVFFDEMDSLFRTRGSGVSSDVENTIVPQLLSEIDGVEGLENVLVIGASNREDMIDPAILRPGRLDVKIKIERPDAEAAKDIFSKYVLTVLPLHPDDLAENEDSRQSTVDAMIQRTVERMYTESEENRFLEVTYANGDKEVLYFKDFNSGAMIENIVARAKKMAIKEFLETGQKGMRVSHLLAACVDEFSENEDLPNTTNPDDWARISGKKGERIVYIRTLVSGKTGTEAGRSITSPAAMRSTTSRGSAAIGWMFDTVMIVAPFPGAPGERAAGASRAN
jgi:proteasome ATPase